MPTFRFHQFQFDSRMGRLLKGGSKVRLQRKPQQLLAVLLEHAGEIVTREQLRSCLWPDEAYRDFETGLNVAVKKLRDALCDSADQPIYVATEVGLGYRFIASVSIIAEDSLVRDDSSASTRHSKDESTAGVATVLAPITPSPPFYRRPVALLSAAAAVFLLAALGFAKWNQASAARPLRAVITLPPALRLMATSENLGLALSPDGTQMVFSASGPDNQPALWLRRMDSLAPEAIPGTEGGAFPFWSPDGKDIGFFAGTQLKRTDLADHSIRTLSAVITGRGGTWSKEGVILFSPDTRGPIYRIRAEGGQASPVTALDEARYTTHRWPTFFSDGRHFAYLAANHDKSGAPSAVFLGSLDGGPTKLLGESDSNVIPVDGSLLFLSHGKLMSQSLNLESGMLEAHADILAEAVEFDAGLWYGEFSAAATELVYRPRQDKTATNVIAWFDRRGRKLGDAGPPGIYRDISVAPDGKTIGAGCGDPEVNVCLVHSDGTVTQVTHSGINSLSAWAPDSSFFSYYMHRGQTNYAVGMKPIDEGAPARVVVTSSASIGVSSWHPDKRHALVSRDAGNGRLQYFIFDLTTNGMSPYVAPDIGLSQYARFSPDGNWVAYSKESAGKEQIFIVPYPSPTFQVKVNGAEGRGPKWRGDGREFYYLGTDGNLYAVSVTPTSGSLNTGTPHILFRPPIPPAPWDVGSFDVTRDGTRFLVNTMAPQGPSELVLSTNWQKSTLPTYFGISGNRVK